MRCSETFAARAEDVAHAITAGETNAAIQLLTTEWSTWAPLFGSTFRELIDTLPPESWASDARILTIMGASYRSLGSPSRSAALPYFRTAEALIRRTQDAPIDTVAKTGIQHAAALRSLGRFAEAHTLASSAWKLLDTDVSLAPAARVALQARAALQQGMIAIHAGEYDLALDRLRLALGLSEDVLALPELVECLSGLSFLAYTRGDFPGAETYAARARENGFPEIIESPFGVLTLIVELLLAVERRNLPDARALSQKVQVFAARSDWEPLSLYALAAATILTRQHIVGLGHAREALQLTRTWTGQVTVRTLCEGMQGMLYIHLGEIDKAFEIIEDLAPTQNHANCPARFMAGMHFTAGDSHACIAVLEECEELGDQHSTRTLLDVLLLKAAANYDLKNYAVADVAFDSAMLIASSTGIRGPFTLIPHSTMRWMLARAESRIHSTIVHATLDEFAAGLDGTSQPLESLSEREKDIAQHLGVDKTLGEIAAELFISTNTVKTHVKSIYRMLEATHRKDAVRRARELGLTAEITRA